MGQPDARCLFEHEELPPEREQIQENPAELVGLGEVSGRPCTSWPASKRQRLYSINRELCELPFGLSWKRNRPSRNAATPSDPLLSPVGDSRDRQKVAELNRVPAFQCAGQEKDLLLKVRSQTE